MARINLIVAPIMWHFVSLSGNKTDVKPPFSPMKEDLTQYFVGPEGVCEPCVNSEQAG